MMLLAQTFCRKNDGNGVYVIGFFYPVVPKGKAKLEFSFLTYREHLDKPLVLLRKIEKELGVIS